MTAIILRVQLKCRNAPEHRPRIVKTFVRHSKPSKGEYWVQGEHKFHIEEVLNLAEGDVEVAVNCFVTEVTYDHFRKHGWTEQ